MDGSDELEVRVWKRLWELREQERPQIESRMREEDGAGFMAHLRTGGYDGGGLAGSRTVVKDGLSAGTRVRVDLIAYLSWQP